MRFCLPIVAAFLTSLAAPAADNWPAFRGPNDDGTSDARNIPTEFSETQNVRWKTPIHGKGWSSPVVWGNQVWVTTADEEGVDPKVQPPRTGGTVIAVQRATFYAVGVDRKTGKVIHDVKLRAEDKPAYCIPFNSYASPTPVIEEGRLYAHFGSHGTWCVDTTTGKVLWERIDLKCNHFRGPASSPILYKNLLILIFDGFDFQYVAALDKATGKTVWKQDRNIKYKSDNGDYKKAYATARVIEVNGKPELVCPSAENTIAYDPMTGAELWRVVHTKRMTMNGASRPIAGHGLVYLTSGHPAELLAVKQGVTGTVPKESIAWETDKSVPSRPSLLLVGDLLFMVSDGGIASCLEAKTGKVVWSERLDGEYSASPVCVAGNIYLANQTGKVSVVAADRKFTLVAVNKLDVTGAPSPAGFMASPAVAGDAMFLRTRANLYCIGQK